MTIHLHSGDLPAGLDLGPVGRLRRGAGGVGHQPFGQGAGQLILVAHQQLLELVDIAKAPPVRQFVGGMERKVVLGPAGLAFDRDGDIVEQAPAREAVAGQIGEMLNARGGVALIVDYGHSQSSPGDTLQAVRGHRYAAVLHDPGEQDLTAHVDFGALAKAASAGGAEATKVVTQGAWLERAGIRARADALARANPEKAEAIRLALGRLVGADAMGELFKVIAVHSGDWPRPAGFE